MKILLRKAPIPMLLRTLLITLLLCAGLFVGMIKRHLAFKKKYLDRPSTHGKPYEGIEYIKAESKKIVEIFMLGLPQK
jgi:hypothetical protein